jgi:hypothetical protein
VRPQPGVIHDVARGCIVVHKGALGRVLKVDIDPNVAA